MQENLNILAERSQWNGHLELCHDTHINGIFHGEVRSKHAMTIGKNAQIMGIIYAKSVEIFGSIDCYVVATDKVEIHAGSRVIGTIRCDNVVVHEGAHVAGLSISHCGS